MSNQQLAHKLLLDHLLFQLDKSGECSTENPTFHNIREWFYRASKARYSIKDDAKLDPPCCVRLIRVLEETCGNGIHDLSTDPGIHEVADLAFVKQQAEAGLYTWPSLSTQKLLSAIVPVGRASSNTSRCPSATAKPNPGSREQGGASSRSAQSTRVFWQLFAQS